MLSSVISAVVEVISVVSVLSRRFLAGLAIGLIAAVAGLLVLGVVLVVLDPGIYAGVGDDDSGVPTWVFLALAVALLLLIALGLRRVFTRPREGGMQYAERPPDPPTVRFLGWAESAQTTKGRQVPYALAIASVVVGMITGVGGVVVAVVTA